MGEILAAACDCGYEADDLFVGAGMGRDSCTDLASCAHCRELVTVRSSALRFRCPTCRRKVVKMDLPNFDEPLRAWSHGSWD